MYGSRLRYLRKKNKYTLNYVADKLNVTHSTISKYENEKLKIDPDTLCSFCKLYNVSADYILGIPNNMPYPEEDTSNA